MSHIMFIWIALIGLILCGLYAPHRSNRLDPEELCDLAYKTGSCDRNCGRCGIRP